MGNEDFPVSMRMQRANIPERHVRCTNYYFHLCIIQNFYCRIMALPNAAWTASPAPRIGLAVCLLVLLGLGQHSTSSKHTEFPPEGMLSRRPSVLRLGVPRCPMSSGDFSELNGHLGAPKRSTERRRLGIPVGAGTWLYACLLVLGSNPNTSKQAYRIQLFQPKISFGPAHQTRRRRKPKCSLERSDTQRVQRPLPHFDEAASSSVGFHEVGPE